MSKKKTFDPYIHSSQALPSDQLNNNKPKFGKSDLLSELEKYEEKDRIQPLETKFLAKQGFSGNEIKTKVNNKKFLWFLLIPFILIISIYVFVYISGNPTVLQKGVDFRSKTCGVNELSNKNFLYFPIANVEFNLKMCVDKCPNVTGIRTCLYHPDGQNLYRGNDFCYTSIQSYPIGNICFPVEIESFKKVQKWYFNITSILTRFFGDIYTTIDLLIWSLISSIFLFNVFLQLTRNSKGIKALFSIGLIFGILYPLFVAYVFHLDYNIEIKNRCYLGIIQNNCQGPKGNFLYIMQFVMLGITFFSFLFILIPIRKLILTIKSLSYCSFIFKLYFQIKYFIFLVFTINFGLIVFLIYIILYSFSSGKVEIVDALSVNGNKLKIYNFYWFSRVFSVWTIYLFLIIFNFIKIIIKAIVSFSFTEWYFTRNKQNIKLRVWKALKIVIKYNLGDCFYYSFQYSSLIIFKIIISFLKKILRNRNQKSNIIRFFISSFKLFFNWYNNVLRFLDDRCFIQLSLWDINLTKAKQKWLFLIKIRKEDSYFHNKPQIENLFFSLQLLVGSIISAFSFLIIIIIKRGLIFKFDDIDFLYTSPLICLIFSFMITNISVDILKIFLYGLFQCSLMDEEMFVGEQRFVEKFLINILEPSKELSLEIKNDKSFCGINFTKKENYTKLNQILAIDNYEFSEEEEDTDNEENKIKTSSNFKKTNDLNYVKNDITNEEEVNEIDSGIDEDSYSKENEDNFDEEKTDEELENELEDNEEDNDDDEKEEYDDESNVDLNLDEENIEDLKEKENDLFEYEKH